MKWPWVAEGRGEVRPGHCYDPAGSTTMTAEVSGEPLNGAVALVTGAARGIGRGCALELARAGADVAVVDVQHVDEAQAVVAEIERLGRRAGFWPADAGDREAMARVVAETAQQFGRLDVAVANAGLSVREPFLEVSPEGL